MGDIEQVILFYKYDKTTSNWWFPTKFCDDDLEYIMHSTTIKHFQVHNQIQSYAFEHHFSMKSFGDLNLIFYIKYLIQQWMSICKENPI